MSFAVVLPWWGYALAFGAAVILGWLAYARVPVRLTLGKRLGLSALRAFTLLLLLAILLRPGGAGVPCSLTLAKRLGLSALRPFTLLLLLAILLRPVVTVPPTAANNSL